MPKQPSNAIKNIIAIGIMILWASNSCQHIESTPVMEIPVIQVANTQDQTFYEDFEQFFEGQMNTSQCPGAAMVVVKDGSVAYMKGFGLRQVDSEDSVDNNTVFRIGSLSKGFTGVLTAKLIEQGHFDWEDKVTDILPSFTLKDSSHANRISIKNLLSHSTGIGRHSYTNLIEDGKSISEIIPMFSTLSPYGKEGEMFSYQNAAFSMIEEIVKIKTGRTFQDLLQKELIDPIGMSNTSTNYEAITQNNNVALPHGYSRLKQSYYSRSINKKYYNAVSAGGINVSISDMRNWLQALLGHKPDVVSQEVLESVFSPVVNINAKRRYRRWNGVQEVHYGIGWRILKYDNKEIVYHAGSVNNYVGQIAINREKNLAICILYNAANYSLPKVIPEFLKRFEEYDERQSRPLPLIGAMPPKPALLGL